jgi:hypothetical protein
MPYPWGTGREITVYALGFQFDWFDLECSSEALLHSDSNVSSRIEAFFRPDTVENVQAVQDQRFRNRFQNFKISFASRAPFYFENVIYAP